MHFLGARVRELCSGYLDFQHACVKVTVVDRNTLQLADGEISIFKGGVALAQLPKEVRILGPDGKQIKPSGVFVVTLETFDPWHLVADIARDRCSWFR